MAGNGAWLVFPSDSDRIYFSFSNSKCTSHHFGVFPMIFKIQRKWLNRARSKGNRSLNSSVYLTRLGRGAIHCGWIVPILYLFILWAANKWARHYYFNKNKSWHKIIWSTSKHKVACVSRKGLISNSCGSICTSVERYGRTRNSSLWSSFSWVGLQIEGQSLITYPCSTALRRGLSLICYFKIIALIFASLSWTLNFLIALWIYIPAVYYKSNR